MKGPVNAEKQHAGWGLSLEVTALPEGLRIGWWLLGFHDSTWLLTAQLAR